MNKYLSPEFPLIRGEIYLKVFPDRGGFFGMFISFLKEVS